jgi:hypothetical protein
MHNLICDRRDGAAHALLDRGRPAVRVGKRLGASEAEGEEHDDPVVGSHEPELPRAGADLLAHRLLDRRGVDVELLGRRGLADRLQVGPNRVDLGDLRDDRGFDLLRDPVRPIERQVPGQLDVQ